MTITRWFGFAACKMLFYWCQQTPRPKQRSQYDERKNGHVVEKYLHIAAGSNAFHVRQRTGEGG